MLNIKPVSWAPGLWGAVTFVVRDLRPGHAAEPAHARVARARVAGIQMAHLVGFPARAGREFFVRRVCRAGICADLQFSPAVLG